MNMQAVYDLIMAHEGLKLKPYKCSANKLTIGIGRNLEDNGITEEEARFMFENDLAKCIKDLHVVFPNQFQTFPEPIQKVLMDMRFQLGPGRFRGFKKMIRAVEQGDLQEMIVQMKNSQWYRQVPNRANDLIKLVQALIN